jgi:hypothetical protein
MASDIREIDRQLQDQGWRQEETSKGHVRYLPPDAKAPIVVRSGTPSDHRAWDNFMAQLKRSGAKLEKTQKHTRRQQRSVPSQVLQIMKDRPGHTFTTDEVALIFGARNPGRISTKSSVKTLVGVAFCNLHSQGEITRVAMGQYVFKAPPAPKPAPEAAFTPANDPKAALGNGSNGPAQLALHPMPALGDQDMRQLTAALYDALGTIEKIVAKYTALQSQHHKLRQKIKELAETT